MHFGYNLQTLPAEFTNVLYKCNKYCVRKDACGMVLLLLEQVHTKCSPSVAFTSTFHYKRNGMHLCLNKFDTHVPEFFRSKLVYILWWKIACMCSCCMYVHDERFGWCGHSSLCYKFFALQVYSRYTLPVKWEMEGRFLHLESFLVIFPTSERS